MAKKLYVGNLAYSVTNDVLRDMFSAHGSVVSAEVVMDRETGRSKGFGFVEMSTDAESDAAAAALNGQENGGRVLKVSQSNVERQPGAPLTWGDSAWATWSDLSQVVLTQ